MKPLQHARISAHRHGGRWEDYIRLHTFLDSSKAAFPSAQHRAILHSSDLGPALAAQVLGRTVRNADGAEVDTAQLVRDHVEEDLGWPCRLADWVEQLPWPPWLRRTPRLPAGLEAIADDPAAGLARRWRAAPADFAPLVDWFDQPRRLAADPRQQLVLHNAFGIFLAEQALGPAIRTSHGRLVAARDAAELLVLARTGMIPTLQDILGRVRLASWMAGSVVRTTALQRAAAAAVVPPDAQRGRVSSAGTPLIPVPPPQAAGFRGDCERDAPGGSS